MDRVLEVRRPPEQSQVALSRASKIFFGCDIFQVIAVVVFQSSMIALGDFSAYDTEDPGMGPGRRIYMAIYMGAVVYTCFLCLFAVKRQNFMEIVAFDLQNYAFVTYSFIQLYHVGFKKYNGSRTSKNDALPKIVIANAITLLLLSVVFTYLSYKLYMEFGWKIYKRMRFNVRLRGIYQIYELLSCLLKMDVLYWSMFAIVHSLVLLRDANNFLYFLSLAFIPLSFVYAGLGYYATRRENRCLMLFFLIWSVAGIGYFLYKLYGFLRRNCIGCEEFKKTGKDIPDEAFMHFVYLGTVNLVVAITIFGVALKAYLNFGGGLAEHFKRKKKPQFRLPGRFDLGLGRGSHAYPEESVVSTTSYEFDEFGESVRLDREVLHPALTALLNENGQNLTDKRSCSLPNLQAESPKTTKAFPGPGEGNMSRLGGWLRAREGKHNSVPRELACIPDEKPDKKSQREAHYYGRKQASDDKMYHQDSGHVNGPSSSACENSAESPNNGDATPNFHVNGYMNKRNQHAEVHDYRDGALAPELEPNGHLLGKARLKSAPETEAENSGVSQALNNDDGQISAHCTAQGVSNGKRLHLQNQPCQRTVHLNRSSSRNDEVFDSLPL